MRKWTVVLGVVAVCWVGGVVKAQLPPLSLQLSSPDDLMGLVVGDTATINVSLADLLPGEELMALTGSVLFDPALMGTPLSITAGAIIPNPADFLNVGLLGQADGTFLALGTDYIAANGVFYSFEVQAQAPGAGVFEFDPPALIAEQFAGVSEEPLLRFVSAGSGLLFSIGPGGPPPIPAPPALGLVLIGLACIRRGRRSNR